MSACLGYNFASSAAFFGPEMVQGADEDVQECVRRAADCPSVMRCVGLDGPSCTEGSRCDGNIAVRCVRMQTGDMVEVRTDCQSSSGMNVLCQMVQAPGREPLATCVASRACGRARCEGEVLVACELDVELRTDCAATGRTCIAGAAAPLCAYAKTCSQSHCDGSVATTCQDGHVVSAYDCGEFFVGSECSSQPMPYCKVAVPDPGCVEEDSGNWCEGDLGVGCSGGVRFEVDCTAFADGECEIAGEHGRNARCRAREGN